MRAKLDIICIIASLLAFAGIIGVIVCKVLLESLLGHAVIDESVVEYYATYSYMVGMPCIFILVLLICYFTSRQSSYIGELLGKLKNRDEAQTRNFNLKLEEAIERKCQSCMRLEDQAHAITKLEQELEFCKQTGKAVREAGLSGEVVKLLASGKTREEIAALLQTPEYGPCTNPQIGALLCPNIETNADGKLKYGQRLVGKA